MFQPLTVFLFDEEGNMLAVDDDLDAPSANRFETVAATRSFVESLLGFTAYRATDDCVTVPETVAYVKVYEGQNDVTAQL